MRIITILMFILAARVSYANAESVGVVVTGEATVQPQLVRHIEGWLRKHHHELVSTPLPPDAINSLVDCFVIQDEACARGVIDKRAKSASVVYARVDVTAAGDLQQTVTVVAYWFVKGAPAVAERRFCERCNEQSLRNATDDVMVALAAAANQGSGHLKLTSKPGGAKVTVDKQPVGVTPLDYELAPGTHQITVTRDRHAIETRDVVIVSGKTITLDVPLVPLDPVDGDGGGTNPKLVPGLVLGGGGALLVTGAILFATSEEDDGSKPSFRETRPAGIAIGVAGVAALGVGGYLWYRASKSKPERSAPTATLVRGGAILGWGRSF